MMSDKSKKPLGKGLSALLGDAADLTVLGKRDSAQLCVPTEFLHSGEYQPRKDMNPKFIEDLAASIQEKGIIQPILVRKSKKINMYEIIAGERRWRAAQIAQLHEVPVIIKNLNDQETLELGLIENIQRRDLSALEEADGFKRLMNEFGYTQETLAKSLSKSRSHIANMLRLLNLPISIKNMLEIGDLSIGHARALLGAQNQETLARYIIKKDLTVRETEKLCNASNKSARSFRPNQKEDHNLVAIESRLENLLGIKVSIKSKGGTGSLLLKFSNLDQFDHILEQLGLSESQ